MDRQVAGRRKWAPCAGLTAMGRTQMSSCMGDRPLVVGFRPPASCRPSRSGSVRSARPGGLWHCRNRPGFAAEPARAPMLAPGRCQQNGRETEAILGIGIETACQYAGAPARPNRATRSNSVAVCNCGRRIRTGPGAIRPSPGVRSQSGQRASARPLPRALLSSRDILVPYGTRDR